MIVTHKLKTAPNAYWAIANGEKTFELRRNDRFFQTGDFLELYYFDAALPNRAHREPPIRRRIGWMLTGGQYGLKAGYVAFSLENFESYDGGLSALAKRKLDALTDQVNRIQKVIGNNPALGPNATRELENLKLAAQSVAEIFTTKGD
ncbi:MAG: DUF3850 domain-containing protein [Robiginitomaculum sp.]|nr:DUF3850 domain-containing protein [Robiginitomaculum sp.]